MSTLESQQTSPSRQNYGLWATLAKVHAAGTVLPQHQHRSGQLVFATRGVMVVETAQARWTIPPQRALWVPPGQVHAIQVITRTEMRTVYCQPALIAECPGFARRDEVHAVMASPLIRELVEGLFDPVFTAAQGTMVRLLLQILPHTPTLPTQLPMPHSQALRAVVALVLAGQRWDQPVGELAAAAAMSERSFSRHFAAEVGLNFRAWRQRARIIASLDLLAATRPVKVIAQRLQFASDAAYIAAFRELLGVTPHVFRTAGREVRGIV